MINSIDNTCTVILVDKPNNLIFKESYKDFIVIGQKEGQSYPVSRTDADALMLGRAVRMVQSVYKAALSALSEEDREYVLLCLEEDKQTVLEGSMAE